MEAHSRDFTIVKFFFSVTKGPDYDFELCNFSKESKYTLLLFEGIEGIQMCAMFFPLDFEGKIH